MYYNRNGKKAIKVRSTTIGTLYRTVEKYIKDYGSTYKQVPILVNLTTIQDNLPVFISKEDKCNNT